MIFSLGQQKLWLVFDLADCSWCLRVVETERQTGPSAPPSGDTIAGVIPHTPVPPSPSSAKVKDEGDASVIARRSLQQHGKYTLKRGEAFNRSRCKGSSQR